MNVDECLMNEFSTWMIQPLGCFIRGSCITLEDLGRSSLAGMKRFNIPTNHLMLIDFDYRETFLLGSN